MSLLAETHCCGSHVHFLILWPLSISSTSEIVAHQAAGCDVLQRIHRADKRAAQGFSLLFLFGFYLLLTIFFGSYIIICVIFPRLSNQEVSDLRPGPSMHGLPWHLHSTTEDWTTSQIKTDIIVNVNQRDVPVFLSGRYFFPCQYYNTQTSRCSFKEVIIV